MSRIFTSTTTFLSASSVPASLTAVPLTLAAWVKFSSLGAQSVIFTVGVNGSALNKFNIRTNTSNAVLAEACDGAACSNATTVATISDTTTWHLITGVFDATNSRSVQIDAGSKISGAGVRIPTIATSDAMRIGLSLNGFNFFPGNIAYVAAWNIGLSDADITNLLTLSPDQVQPANLVDMWGLLNNQSPEPDSGSANVNMTVNGAPGFSTDNPQINFGPVVMPWVRA